MTTDTDTLVARLRDNATLDECEGCNPDVVALEREAADRIEALEAEVARLRKIEATYDTVVKIAAMESREAVALVSHDKRKEGRP